MRVYLVGFMGAGKTTIGKALAERLRVPFYDLDALIEAVERRSVREIFDHSGEAAFRARERDVLRSTRFMPLGVVATGGGTFTLDDNLLFIKSEGFSVYLSVSFSQVLKRLAGKTADRPLFRDERAAFELYQRRTKYYRLADLTIEIGEEDTAVEIVERLMLELPKACFGPDNAFAQ